MKVKSIREPYIYSEKEFRRKFKPFPIVEINDKIHLVLSVAVSKPIIITCCWKRSNNKSKHIEAYDKKKHRGRLCKKCLKRIRSHYKDHVIFKKLKK